MTPFWSPDGYADRRVFLEGRTKIVRAVRAWFETQGFTEVEPTVLATSPGAEIHVDAFETDGRYLHTSPEFAMKKLLAAGEEKIFYFGKCWRRGETGPLHAEEFTMLEWYRANAPYERAMDDCVALARLATATIGVDALRWKERTCDPFAEARKVTVREAFDRYLPIPPHALQSPPPSPQGQEGIEERDAFSTAIVQIEPNLGSPALTLLTEYPIGEAALAQRCEHDPSVAERFEMYACGVELANGFGELTDPVEQRARLIAAMLEKETRYGKRWPIDEDFLAALAHMPPASGVALGFDRLVTLATGARRINDVQWAPPG